MTGTDHNRDARGKRNFPAPFHAVKHNVRHSLDSKPLYVLEEIYSLARGKVAHSVRWNCYVGCLKAAIKRKNAAMNAIYTRLGKFPENEIPY